MIQYLYALSLCLACGLPFFYIIRKEKQRNHEQQEKQDHELFMEQLKQGYQSNTERTTESKPNYTAQEQERLRAILTAGFVGYTIQQANKLLTVTDWNNLTDTEVVQKALNNDTKNLLTL